CARQAHQLRAGSSDTDDLEPAGAIRAGRMQIQNDVTRFDPEQMAAAPVGGDDKNIDMTCLDGQHPFAIVEQPGMTGVDYGLLVPALRGLLPRGLAAGRFVAHSVTNSLA